MGSCVQRVWVAGGGGLSGQFREQRQPVGVQKCQNDFTDDALTASTSSLFQNGTVLIRKAYWLQRGKLSPLVELIVMAA